MRVSTRWERGANQVRVKDFDQVTVPGALDQTDDALGDKATDGAARGGGGEEGSAGKPVDGETEARLAFKKRVADEVRVDGALDDGEAKAGNENVFKLLPEKQGIEFLVVHGGVLMAGGRRAAKNAGVNPAP